MEAPDQPGEDEVSWFDERGGDEGKGCAEEEDEKEGDAHRVRILFRGRFFLRDGAAVT